MVYCSVYLLDAVKVIIIVDVVKKNVHFAKNNTNTIKCCIGKASWKESKKVNEKEKVKSFVPYLCVSISKEK